MADTTTETLSLTPLDALHRALGGKMVPFAGYALPVNYPAGILAEHQHTRASASLFDVSHMGQVARRGAGAATALETLLPGDIAGLGAGRMRYTFLTNERGGILDDLMVTHAGDHLFVVVNASRKAEDIAHIAAGFAGKATVEPLPDRALLALQGPKAVDALARLAPAVRDLDFLSGTALAVGGVHCFVTRSGYTGEDGFELSVLAAHAEALARRLLAEPEVKPAGLGARDSLRLEAGLCLYGHDIDETTTPVEAGLAWAIGKRRRASGGFPGDAVIRRQLAEGPARKRVGIRPAERAPAREGTEITDGAGRVLGKVTSGGFGPTVGAPVAMGYVESKAAAEGTKLGLLVRGTERPAHVAALPFVPHRYRRPASSKAS
ncbi:MAG: glycine cleavage system aminomethyltransferase GcvT [Candidatus Eiseniibacteriota bacterium]